MSKAKKATRNAIVSAPVVLFCCRLRSYAKQARIAFRLDPPVGGEMEKSLYLKIRKLKIKLSPPQLFFKNKYCHISLYGTERFFIIQLTN